MVKGNPNAHALRCKTDAYWKTVFVKEKGERCKASVAKLIALKSNTDVLVKTLDSTTSIEMTELVKAACAPMKRLLLSVRVAPLESEASTTSKTLPV